MTVTLLITGAVLITVTLAEPLTAAPLASVAVIVHSIPSPGLTMLLLKLKVEAVPSVLVPFFQR